MASKYAVMQAGLGTSIPAQGHNCKENTGAGDCLTRRWPIPGEADDICQSVTDRNRAWGGRTAFLIATDRILISEPNVACCLLACYHSFA